MKLKTEKAARYLMRKFDKNCLFCRIVKGEEPSKKVLETEKFLVIYNKYPIAPVHLLVLDRVHNEKKDTISGAASPYWDEMFKAVYKAIKEFGLDRTGYKLVNNGAGYNHFEHEHLHILGGTRGEPGGKT